MALTDKEQKIIAIIKDDENQRNYFFSKAEELKWFFPLKNASFFNLEKFPIINTSKNEQNKSVVWFQLSYLHKVTEQLIQNPNRDYLDCIIGIIKEIIISNYVNYWVDDRITILLGIIEQDHISFNLLKRHLQNLDKSLEAPRNAYYVTDNLFQKVINTNDDDKISLLVNHYFGFYDVKNSGLGENRKTKYDSGSFLHDFSTDSLISKLNTSGIQQLINKMVEILIPEIRNLEDGSNFKFSEDKNTYLMTLKFLDVYDLEIFITGNKEFIFEIVGFNNLNADAIIDQINKNLKANSIDINKIKIDGHIGEYMENLSSIFKLLYSENIAVIHFDLINLKAHNYHDEDLPNLLHVLVLLIKKLADKSPIIHEKIINDFMNDSQYYLPVFKRITLHFISQNYKDLNTIFWDNIEKHNFLSDYRFDDDVYSLIKNNINDIKNYHLDTFVRLIESGSEKSDEKNDKHWKYKWYSLLKDLPDYSEKYMSLKNEIDGKDFKWQQKGVMTMTGVSSPISRVELEKMSVTETVNYLTNYKRDRNNFRGPDKSGLAHSLEQLVKDDPEKYLKQISLFEGVNNTYVNAITSAFVKRISPKLDKYIASLIEFYKGYLTTENFRYDKRKEEDLLRNTPGIWTISSILELFQKIVSNDKIELKDESSFDKIYSLAIQIRKNIPTNYYKDDPNQHGYIMFALNNPEGKYYNFLFQLSLREGRQLKYQNRDWRYKSDFQRAMKVGNENVFTILGQYLDNFLWLNEEFIKSEIKALVKGSKSWHAFVGGYLPRTPIFNNEIYLILNPTYFYLIDNKIDYSITGGHGLGTHLALLFYNGFIFLDKNGLIDKYYNLRDKNVFGLISTFRLYSTPLKSLLGQDKVNFENSLISLVEFIYNKYKNCDDEYCNKVLLSTYSLLNLFDNLNSSFASILMKISNKPLDFNRSISHTFVDNIEIYPTKEYANFLLEIWKNSYKENLIIQFDDNIIKIWDFIIENVDNETNKKEIRSICAEYVKSYNPSLSTYFLNLAGKISN